jgi:asparagine synthase (glutamine-hydrolysing)
MNYTITMDNSAVTLGRSGLYFRGYIVQDGKLLYDAQAEAVLDAVLLEKSPTDLFNSINGAFRFVYLMDNILYFSVDHFGGYSLFYRLNGKSIDLFDNPMLLPQPGKISDTAICTILATGFTLGQDTIFEGVQECQPGTLYSFDCSTGKLASVRWFGYYSFNEKLLDNSKLHELIGNLFPAVEHGQYTLSLSGGIDSRLLFGALLKKNTAFHTYSFGSEFNRDRQIATDLAARFKVPHFRHDFTPETCSRYYTKQDLDFILKYCTFGRSLPNETDLISSRQLDPAEHIIVKGFGGDWLTGRYLTPHLLNMNSEAKMSHYLFGKYFRLTCISSGSFRKHLSAYFEESMQANYYANNPGLVSAEEQWNLHHNERKYIINTLAYYKAQGFRFYLPYFDRRLMHYFSRIKYVDKIDQNGYFQFLSKHYFIGKYASLRDIPTLRGNFLAPFEPSLLQKFGASAHEIIRNLDTKKLRKRFAVPSVDEYADSLMLFTHQTKTVPYLKNPVGKNFPDILPISEALSSLGCPRAAAHLRWLSRQATSQMNINGLSLCKFFFHPEFLKYLNTLTA